jgi:hypothetical protein
MFGITASSSFEAVLLHFIMFCRIPGSSGLEVFFTEPHDIFRYVGEQFGMWYGAYFFLLRFWY